MPETLTVYVLSTQNIYTREDFIMGVTDSLKLAEEWEDSETAGLLNHYDPHYLVRGVEE